MDSIPILGFKNGGEDMNKQTIMIGFVIVNIVEIVSIALLMLYICVKSIQMNRTIKREYPHNLPDLAPQYGWDSSKALRLINSDLYDDNSLIASMKKSLRFAIKFLTFLIGICFLGFICFGLLVYGHIIK